MHKIQIEIYFKLFYQYWNSRGFENILMNAKISINVIVNILWNILFQML